MPKRPVVLIHGYSAASASFERWCAILADAGYDPELVHLTDYVSLSNEITIKDIAEGLDRALRDRHGLSADEPFDAIVHSTGGLVIRDWLATYGSRRRRLKHLVALAPAMFGSPLAHRGRSWLAAVFKGEDELGPDFMETGHQVLSGLEMGSSYTWQLAHRDLLREDVAMYDTGPDSPYPFVFIGLEDYGWLARRVTKEKGSDGTVRWAAASLNTRKIVVDLTRQPGSSEGQYEIADWRNVDAPFVLVPGLNHGTILSKPTDELVGMVLEALAVEDWEAYKRFDAAHSAIHHLDAVDEDRWQQFVIRLVDERGDPVPNWHLELGGDGPDDIYEDFAQSVHPFAADNSFRCFHVNLSELKPSERTALHLRLAAVSGTDLVAYHGAGSQTFTREGDPVAQGDRRKWDAQMDLTPLLRNEKIGFFAPYTTTLIEIRLNREPMPAEGPNRVFRFA